MVKQEPSRVVQKSDEGSATQTLKASPTTPEHQNNDHNPQTAGQTYTSTTDIWSLGVVLYATGTSWLRGFRSYFGFRV